MIAPEIRAPINISFLFGVDRSTGGMQDQNSTVGAVSASWIFA
jgi:hypothetical protein